MKQKVYAYVTNESCGVHDARKPGSRIGNEYKPVSKHGDYVAWTYNKKETLSFARGEVHGAYRNLYHIGTAQSVAALLGWE